MYRALPYNQGRQELFKDLSLTQFRSEFETQLKTQILPALDLKVSQLEGVRLTRWGHALPIAQPGLIHQGHVDWLRKPFQKRIFFAHQDNWALPAFETSGYEAMWVADLLEKQATSLF